LAIADGVRFEWLVQPLEFLSRDGELSGVRCQRLELIGKGRQAHLEPVPGSEFEVPCDMVVKALGQSPLSKLLQGVEGLDFVEGRVIIDPATGATSLAGLYAGGDCISKGAELVHAVQQGKIAARGIDRYLKEKHGQA
ncbi:FAD-dependent oxidoreductase, partial [bacterium]|nr:FAD-dependent oxidoreductase [bacterium]